MNTNSGSVFLGDYCIVDSGYAFKSELFSADKKDVNLVKGSNLGHKCIDWEGGPRWSINEFEKLQRYELVLDDIVLAMDQPIVGGNLKFSWIKGNDPKALLVQRVARLRAKSGLDQTFLRYVIDDASFLLYTNTITTGTTVPHISGPDIRKYKLLLPKYKTQQKIAAILSTHDDLIENNVKRIKLLEEMAQITYEEWFIRKLFPDHETTTFDTETGLPEGWNTVSLNEVTTYINRGIVPKYVENDGFPVINQKCIRNHFVNFDKSRLTIAEHKIVAKKLLRILDILVNSTGTGTLGRVAQLFDNKEKSTVDTHVTIIRSSDGISPYFLGRSLEVMEPFLESLGKGATNQQELGRADLANVKICIPTVELMNKYDELATPVFNAITNFRKKNGLLKEARDILLPRLMTGMIDVDKIELPKR